MAEKNEIKQPYAKNCQLDIFFPTGSMKTKAELLYLVAVSNWSFYMFYKNIPPLKSIR